MTCQEFHTMQTRDIDDSTLAELSAANEHFWNCDTCHGAMQRRVASILARMGLEGTAEAFAKGARRGEEFNEARLHDPELT